VGTVRPETVGYLSVKSRRLVTMKSVSCLGVNPCFENHVMLQKWPSFSTALRRWQSRYR
jgi:hypothetical protein